MTVTLEVGADGACNNVVSYEFIWICRTCDCCMFLRKWIFQFFYLKVVTLYIFRKDMEKVVSRILVFNCRNTVRILLSQHLQNVAFINEAAHNILFCTYHRELIPNCKEIIVACLFATSF